MTQRLLWTQTEAANALGVCSKTLLAEVRLGRLPYVLVGRSRRYDPNDIRGYIEGQKQSWLSEGAKDHPTIGMTSHMGVVDIEEVRSKKRRARRSR